MGRKILAAIAALVLLTAPLSAVLAATDSGINITSPQNGDSIQQSNIQVAGTAPASVLVDIVITDADTSKSLIAHQPNGKVEGSVTSDDGGNWVYTPQTQLVPGQFSVQASYTNAQKQTINSPSIRFVIITVTGASEILSNNARRSFIAGGVIGVVLLSALVFHLARRRRRRDDEPRGPEEERPLDRPRKRLKEASQEAQEAQDEIKEVVEDSSSPVFLRTLRGRRYRAQEESKLKALHEETEKIENQLGAAAEQLEQANQEVVKLEEKIGHQTNPLVGGAAEEPKTETKK